MMKVLAETKGDYQLYDFGTGDMIRSHRPCVVRMSTFLQDRVGRSQIRIISELTDESTDEEFERFLVEAEGDDQFAIDAFLSEFGKEAVVVEDKPKPTRKPKTTKPAEAE